MEYAMQSENASKELKSKEPNMQDLMNELVKRHAEATELSHLIATKMDVLDGKPRVNGEDGAKPQIPMHLLSALGAECSVMRKVNDVLSNINSRLGAFIGQ